MSFELDHAAKVSVTVELGKQYTVNFKSNGGGSLSKWLQETGPDRHLTHLKFTEEGIQVTDSDLAKRDSDNLRRSIYELHKELEKAGPFQDLYFKVPFKMDTTLVVGFDKSRGDLEVIAKDIGGRIATRAANTAVVEYLLAKEEAVQLTPAETKLLDEYRLNWIMDLEGCLTVYDQRIVYCDLDYDFYPCVGALVETTSEESY
jgi:hypothetical protein